MRVMSACSLVGLLLLVLTGGPSWGDPIVFEAEMELDLLRGPDALGLDGAVVKYSVEFDTSQTYIELYGRPAVDSISDSLAISGASVTGTDGTYSEPDGIGFLPTYASGQHAGGGVANGWARYAVNGRTLVLVGLTTPVSGVSVGDNVDVSHFSTTLLPGPFPKFNVVATSFEAEYGVVNFTASVSGTQPVPEPGTLALVSLGAIGFIANKRRRRPK